MSENLISALPDSAVSAISPPKPPVYRSKKKLRMEARYFNTTLPLPISLTHELRRLSAEKPQAVNIAPPTTKYTMNNNSWFKHAFGSEAGGATQASSASYNGKTFNSRPKHYYASESGKTRPTNLKGFNQLYMVADEDDDISMGTGSIGFDKIAVETLSSTSIEASRVGTSSRRLKEKETTTAAATETKKTKKRSLPEEFTNEEDKKRKQARARVEENWEFGRALAKKHVYSLWRDTKAMKKWREVGQQETVEEQQEVRLDVVSENSHLYEKRGNKGSFLFLQVDVVMPLEAMVELTPSP